MGKIFSSALELVGRTPLMEASRFASALQLEARLLVKPEGLNPAGSVKDRVALAMLEDAREKGLLQPGATIIEPTSGNTGIGLCSAAAVLGYKAVIVMPDSMSVERQRLMKAYGAQVVLTPGAEGMAGAIRKAEELSAKIPGSFIPGQFENPANPAAHYRTTGPEIWEDTDGAVDIFVAGAGTGGTVTGVGEYLKHKNPNVKIAAAEPSRSPLLSGGKAGPHGLQGIGANFIPSILNREILDEVLCVTEQDAYETGRLFGKTEGLLVGISAGAALWAAAQLAKRPENTGKTIVALLPDGGDRYLTTPMYTED
ncbi:MAG: cysteine synthase A [Oscillospiraceae bacterium]|nr:cysteine synthase A [Oscillospiraceae bacterium]